MSAIHSLAPSLDQIVSECSPGISPYPVPELLIGALRNWASSVALWNLALDPAGGGVQAPNSGCTGCTGIVTVSEQTHTVAFTRAYYQLGQVGKFVRPGAQRIASEHFVAYYHSPTGLTGTTYGLDDVAFVNPDGRKVLVAYNNSARPIQFAVSFHGLSFQYTLTGRTMVTFAWR
jgi:glucosylceramidase